MRAVGRKVRKARLRRGWSTRDLAQRCDSSAMYVSKLERGLIKRPSRNRFIKLCEALDLDSTKLVSHYYTSASRDIQ